MDFYAFFVTSKCGVMGMGLDVTAGGDKGFFIDKRVYTTFLIPFFLLLGIRCTQDRMVVTRAEVFNVYDFQHQKCTGSSFVTSMLGLNGL